MPRDSAPTEQPDTRLDNIDALAAWIAGGRSDEPGCRLEDYQRHAEMRATCDRITAARERQYRIPLWHRVMSGLVLMLLVALMCGALAAVSAVFGGCAFAPTYDAEGNVTGGVLGFGFGGDEQTYDPNSPPYDAAGKAAGGLIGGLIGGPGGAVIGTSLGGILATAFGAIALKQTKKRGQAEAAKARLEGREAGYDDYENDTTVRVVPPPAPVMVASAPAYAPALASVGAVAAGGVQPVSGTNAAGNSVPSVPVVELKAAAKPRRKA